MQEYILNKVIKSHGFTARVFSPIISNEEREKRMKTIYNASANLLKEVERCNHEKKKQNIP